VTGFDPATPNTARVYSRLLGGKDHFPSDRAEADVLLEIYPPLADMVKENRAFIAEAVTWAANEEIGQFVDLGAGLPVPAAVHQTARAVLPAAQVAYVDTDPMVLSHARALLAGPGVAAVAADLRDPAAVLADPELRAVINCTFMARHPETAGANRSEPERASGPAVSPGTRGRAVTDAQLPRQLRHQVLIRADTGGGTQESLACCPSRDGGCPAQSGSPSPKMSPGHYYWLVWGCAGRK
jgi:S-adenosyl methyltransferase